MLTVVTFLWPPKYGPEHVNAVRNMFAAYLSVPHRFICVTQDRAGLDQNIEIIAPDPALPDDKRYRKLMLFRRDAAAIFGDRMLYVDLDVTVVGDLAPLVKRSQDFVIWRDPLYERDAYIYNSSLILLDAGCRPQVYEKFNAATSPAATRLAGLAGSDQAWISYLFGPGEAVWTQADGVLGWKTDLLKGATWPENARLIVNHGRPKAWELAPNHPLRIAYERFVPEKAAT